MNALALATCGLITRKGTYTMAQEVKKAFVELIDRLKASEEETGTGTLGLLAGVQLIEGPTEQSFADQDMPVIIYEILDGGLVEDTHFPDQARAKMTVMLTIMTLAENGYYNDSKTGILDLYEKIQDVIDQNIDGVLDLTGAGNWGPIPPQYKVGGVERDGLIYTYLVEVTIQTARYRRGSLQS
jgi:hypothetical protein